MKEKILLLINIILFVLGTLILIFGLDFRISNNEIYFKIPIKQSLKDISKI